jgi:ferritin-like protein
MKDQSSPSMGMNRTGIQMSPFDTKNMEKALAIDTEQMASGDTTELAQMRGLYISEADPLGSVPAPGTMKGVVKAGVSKMTGNEPTLLLDKLGERLAFERTGTRLYDALITKFEALQDGTTSMTLADLQQIREDEARHFSMIADAIEFMGGDPTAQTPCADLVGVESMGLMQVITDPRTTLAQSLHAILVAEMVDNSGWEMLIALAEENGQNAMVPDFSLALDEERMHLQKVQGWFEEATIGKIISDGALVDDITDTSSTRLH